MAIVKAPLLSLGASGKIAGTLVATTWKGLKVMREYVKPANPNTVAQAAQRGLFTDAVAAWRNYITDSEIRTAWNKLAAVSGNPQSGFNKAVSSMVQMFKTDPDASYCKSVVEGALGIATFTCTNMDDDSEGDEAGDFEIWVGVEAASLLLQESVALASGDVVSTKIGESDEIWYAELRKDGQSRSGVIKLTLL